MSDSDTATLVPADIPAAAEDTLQPIEDMMDTQELTMLAKELDSQEFYFKKLKDSFIAKFQTELSAGDSGKNGDNVLLQAGHGQVFPDNADNRTEKLDIRRLLLAHPQNTCAEKNFHKELFSKLKFNYLEQAAKESFLNCILQVSPQFATAQTLQTFEQSVKESKEVLKTQKTNFEAQKTEIYELIESTCAAYEQATLQKQQALDLVSDITADYSQYQTIVNTVNPNTSVVEELEKSTLSQTQKLAELRSQIAKQKNALAEQREKRTQLNTDKACLDLKRNEAQENAAEAMRISKSKNPQVEELGKWYQETIALLYKCSGIREVRALSDSNMEIVYEMGVDTTYSVLIRIITDPQTDDSNTRQFYHRVEAQVVDAMIPVDDILDVAAGFSKLDSALSFTVRAVYSRLQNMHIRNQEMTELQKVNSNVMFDAHLGETMIHNTQSGRMFVLQLDVSYPTSSWQGIRMVGVEPARVEKEVELWQNKINTLKPATFTELVMHLE
ncbi:hypothetical protein QVD99_001503 [Batrachochytrium dendrobatidis]|nr:hypothetical protein O5D80_005967 [Batrachochytrium dendrobatidis]KAK5671663.1 hypothetical protein QVD99_001503 [Batrachochytrium dendrobatidis]